MPTTLSPSPNSAFARFDPARIVGFMSVDEYFAFEQAAPEKHEYQEGWVVTVSGGSLEHNRISFDIARALADATEVASVPVEVFGDNQHVYIKSRRFVYPDALMVLGDIQADQNDCARNPFLIVEVLSPSTAGDDREAKFEEYKTVASLQHYVLVEQTHAEVTYHAKTANGTWAVAGVYRDLDKALTLMVDDKTVSVPLARIYRRLFTV